MKRSLLLGLLVLFFSTVVTAQSGRDKLRRHRIQQGFSNRQLTRPEIFDLRKDLLRYRLTERRVRRDGITTPLERKRLQRMKRQNRVQLFRYRHNDRRRVI